MDGILPVYKPVGISSFDVIRAFKRAVHPTFKVGHGGTLDPFADGVLLLLLGKATKKMNELMSLPKTYVATALLGAKSDTLDVTGRIEQCHSVTVSRKTIELAAQSFVGKYEQEIPEYSAAKVGGRPRYLLARQGQSQKPKSKLVTIYSLKNFRFDGSNHRTVVNFEATVGSGTYIRQLSYDIFKQTGIESYLEKLTRTEIGDFSIEKCVQIKDFESGEWTSKVVLQQ